ncbi:hypothetical protein [uncultured Friedmanniella sp.]|uniref:hypothetical protein n=1 Tax=uncultured Friedmanniella sp. TaxID=335381 RepID=UPI0035CAEBA9
MPPHDGHVPYGMGGGLSLLPFFGGFGMLLALAALTLFVLHRQGRLQLPAFGTHRSPEEAAKVILAERFARGDISTEDFMERSSILNWTPGSQAIPVRARGWRRRAGRCA